jgi:ABC-type tungstate transport system permease subunit
MNQNKLTRQCDVHNYNTQNKSDYAIKIHNKKSLSNAQHLLVWNSQTSSQVAIKEEENFSKFKNKPKTNRLVNSFFMLSFRGFL